MPYHTENSRELKDWVAINIAMESSRVPCDDSSATFDDTTVDGSTFDSETLHSCPSPTTTYDPDSRAPSPFNVLFAGIGYNVISTIFSFMSSQNWERSSCVIPPGCFSSNVEFQHKGIVSGEEDCLDFKANFIEFPSLDTTAQVSSIDQHSSNSALTIQDISCGHVLDEIAFCSHDSSRMF